ncbi:FAD-dependent monooxygenase DEP4 [Pseudocercospora fuligena]|uniref:FAD-dependent monooxygenase DEP4 n=1 Tax=Pseudocercospora fuligena TaxID=685502 RepID=A0A8H6RBL2_9PEZI|nr:FAD-dependent monooxygenase DEP4 [Pseudocercospora fuligena]
MEPQQTDEIYDLVVIGAGWSGLVSAKTYLQVKPAANLLIVDGDASIGGTWSKQRLYPNLRCEAGWGYFHFSDLAMDHVGIEREGWIPGTAVNRYLEQYSTVFNLQKRMLLNTTVHSVQRENETGQWKLEVLSTNTLRTTIRCLKLIVATGLTSTPNLPELDRHLYQRPHFHSKDLGLPTTQDVLTGPKVGRVTVYGGSKSAFEAVYLLYLAGKSVDWIIRPDGGGPSLMTPLKMLGFFPSFGLNNTRFFGVLSPNPFDTTSVWHRLFRGSDRLAIADSVVLTFWRVTTWMMTLSAGYGRSSNGEKLRPKLGLESSFWSPATLGVMTCPGLWDAIHSSDRIKVYRSAIQKLLAGAVELDNGICLPSDAAVFATGWQANHDMFPAHTRASLGLPGPSDELVASPEEVRWRSIQSQADQDITQELPILSRSPPGWESCRLNDYRLYRFLVPVSNDYADRSIAYVGFLRNTGLPIVLEAQALWATAYLSGELDVPDQPARELEAARTGAWIRRRYVCGRKVPFALVDWFSYIDVLYGDLGICSRRKRSWFLETFSVYRPEDFKGVVEEWKTRNERKPPSRSRSASRSRFAGAVLLIVALFVCLGYGTVLERPHLA